MMFRHRSRWSHGIIFGTLIRVVYFATVIALLAAVAVYLRAMLTSGAAPGLDEVIAVWRLMETSLRETVGRHVMWVTLAGLWWGAASHTLTDVAWSVMRKSSEIF